MSKKNNKQRRNATDKNFDKSGNSNYRKPSSNANKGKTTQFKQTQRKESEFEKGRRDPKNYINEYTSDGTNDPSWYMVNSKLVHDACKVPTGQMVGSQLTSGNSHLRLPGICALVTAPTVGYSDSSSSAPSRAALAMTEFLRAKLTNDLNFAPADTFMYTNAVDALYTMYCNITRLFGIVGMIQFNNKYTPRALVHALYNFSDDAFNELADNKAKYLYKFNYLIKTASQVYLPVTYTALKRHAWLFSNLFYDSRSSKAQIYGHSMAGTYIFDEISFTTGTANKYLDFMASDRYTTPYGIGDDINPATIDGLLKIFEMQIQALLNSSAALNIRTAFLKAYEGTGAWRMAELDIDYLITPTHTDEVLSQINNTRLASHIETDGYKTSITYEDAPLPDGGIFTGTGSTHPFDVTQDPAANVILCTPFVAITDNPGTAAFAKKAAFFNGGQFMNIHWDDPSVEDMAVATRDMICWTVGTTPINGNGAILTGFSTDVVVALVFCCAPSGDYDIRQYTEDWDTATLTNSIIETWVCFDWAPSLKYMSNNSAHYLQEWDNAFPVDNSTLTDIHEAIATSLYQIPEAGMYTD